MNELESFFKEQGPPDVKRVVDLSLDISRKVYEHIHFHGITLDELSQTMKVEKEEMVKWLSGSYNLNLREIAKLEIALNFKLISCD